MLRLEIDRRNRQAEVRLDEIQDRTRRGIRRFWFALGKTLLKSLTEAVRKKPRSGKTYITRRGGRRRRHVASRAGESPANDTGNYLRGAGFQLRGTSEMLFGVDALYAGFLENGTSKMESRPGLANAVSSTEGESIGDAVDMIERELTN